MEKDRIMLDFIGTIVLTAVIILNINAFTNGLAVSAAARLAMVIVAGAWVGLATAVAAAGVFANASLPFPWVGAFVATPLLVVAAAAVLFPTARAALLRVPLQILIGVNIARALGIFFILLAWSGRLGGPFPQSAGWGDVITGLFAVLVMGLAARPNASRDRAIWLWNAFGTLDLLAAITLGVISANGSPLQLIHAGAGSAAVQALPWSLIPSALVPFYLITHGIIFAQLRVRSAHAADAANQAAHSAWALNQR
jgi:hypothetical protein